MVARALHFGRGLLGASPIQLGEDIAEADAQGVGPALCVAAALIKPSQCEAVRCFDESSFSEPTDVVPHAAGRSLYAVPKAAR